MLYPLSYEGWVSPAGGTGTVSHGVRSGAAASSDVSGGPATARGVTGLRCRCAGPMTRPGRAPVRVARRPRELPRRGAPYRLGMMNR